MPHTPEMQFSKKAQAITNCRNSNSQNYETVLHNCFHDKQDVEQALEAILLADQLTAKALHLHFAPDSSSPATTENGLS